MESGKHLRRSQEQQRENATHFLNFSSINKSKVICHNIVVLSNVPRPTDIAIQLNKNSISFPQPSRLGAVVGATKSVAGIPGG